MANAASAHFAVRYGLLRARAWLAMALGGRAQMDPAVFAFSWAVAALFLLELTLWGCNSFLLGSIAAACHCICAVTAIQLLRPRMALWTRLWPAIACMGTMLVWRVAGDALRDQLLPPTLLYNAGASQAKFALEVGYDACFCLGAVLGFRRSGQTHCLRAMLALGMIWQIFALVIYHSGMLGDWGGAERGGHLRFVATLGNANVAGIAFCMTSLLSLGAIIATLKTFNAITFGNQAKILSLMGLWLIVAVMGFYGTLISQSRLASFLFILMANFQFAVALRTRSFSRRLLFALLSLGIMVLIGLVAAFYMNDVQKLGDFAIKYGETALSLERKARDFAEFFDFSRKSPLFGFGPGAFDMVNLASVTPESIGQRWDYRSAHSILLGNALELGWPHVVLEVIFLAFCAMTIARARARIAWNDGMFAMALALVCVGISGWVDIALDVPAMAALSAWLLGLMVGKALRV